jgi:hypothetical protein
MIQKYLPSKKFAYMVGSIVVAILIIVGIKSLTEWQNGKRIQANADKLAAADKKNVTFQEFMAIDSDTDGLKDWEEALWKTDAKIADTDKDGTSDGEEVKATRDPLKANTAGVNKEPNDKIDPILIASQKKQETEFLALSQTEQLSRTLFSQYLATKGSGALSSVDKQIILDQAISMTKTNSDTPKYQISNIKTFSEIDLASLKNYGNELANRAKNTSKQTIQQELSVLATAIANDDEKELLKLEPDIKLYETIINSYFNLPAPVEAANLHLSIINNLTLIKTDVENMKYLFSDTVQAITAISDYRETTTKLLDDFADLNKYFISRGVIFLPIDPGYKLFNTVK